MYETFSKRPVAPFLEWFLNALEPLTVADLSDILEVKSSKKLGL